MSDGTRSSEEAKKATGAEDDAKPSNPTELTKESWSYLLRRTVRKFFKDQCTDGAAALTYFSVLAIFPAMVATLSIIGLTGNSQQAISTILNMLEDAGGGEMADTLAPALNELENGGGAGFALIVGLGTALWTASGYTGAFGRAMNRIYQIGESGHAVKFRAKMLLVTAALLVMVALVLFTIIMSGSMAQAFGDAVGLGDAALTVWSIVQWPLVLLLLVAIVAMLYWATPNIVQPKFRWMSIGAGVAILVWIIGSVGFFFYVSNFANYNQTYGALAGVIIFLLWLWISNMALLFGAELDGEVERARELQAGIEAEEYIQLPPRSTSKIEKEEEKFQERVDEGRKIREHHSNGRSSSKE